MAQEPERVDSLAVDTGPAQQQAHHQRIGADDPEARAGLASDLRPRAQQHRHALARVVPADEDDPVLATGRVRLRRDQDAVRNQLVVARVPAHRRLARGLGDGDPVVNPVHQEAPHRIADHVPGEVAVGVEGGDDRAFRPGEGGDTDHRRHRLVQVEHVESLAPQDPLDSENRRRAEDDVRECAVRRHDHRAADRDHVRRRPPMPPVTRVEHSREASRRVVADNRPRLDPQSPQRLDLQFDVLVDAAPVGPRVRDDDADLHRAKSLVPAGLR